MMQKLPALLVIIFLLMLMSCSRSGLKKYYTRISPEEFAAYDSVVLAVKSKYGKVYHVWKRSGRGFRLEYFILVKTIKGEKAKYFKMDIDTEIKNDSTFMLPDPQLMTSGDTSDWVKGLWFYTNKQSSSTTFKVDSAPKNIPDTNYQALSMGIYQYKGGKVVKVSDSQSEDAFDSLNAKGFIYLPNPGRFYRLAKFSQIQ